MQKRQERARRLEENKVYLQLHEAMEALIHICRDGCRTIGPRDQTLKSSQAVCRFPACKGIELLLRHFSACKMRVPGGCANCKRIWQLLELHSRMCSALETCHVPLCRWAFLFAAHCSVFLLHSLTFFWSLWPSISSYLLWPCYLFSISALNFCAVLLLQAFQGENATSEQKGGGQVESFGVQGVGEQSNNQFHLRKEKISIPENIVLRSRFTSYKNYALTHKLDVNCEHLLYWRLKGVSILTWQSEERRNEKNFHLERSLIILA